jgi:hypothetical protein
VVSRAERRDASGVKNLDLSRRHIGDVTFVSRSVTSSVCCNGLIVYSDDAALNRGSGSTCSPIAAPSRAASAGCNQRGNSWCAISLTRSGFNLYPCHRLFSIIASIDGSTSPTSLASFFILFRHRRTRRRRTSSDPQLWCATSLTRSGFNLYPCHRLFSITASIDGSTSPTSLGRRTGCYTGGLRQKNKGITRPEERPDPVAD